MTMGIEIGTTLFLRTFGFCEDDIKEHGIEMAEAIIGEQYV